MDIKEEKPFSRAAAATSASSNSAGDAKSALFVAVGGDQESASALIWALRNMQPYNKIMLTHVHCPAQMVPMQLGGWFDAKHISGAELRAFRLEEKKKMNETLDTYLGICKAYKVEADILTDKANDVTTGLLKLVSEKGITRLVMGASAFSRTTIAPTSKTASAMLQQADPSCHISFVSKDCRASTRDSILLNNGTSTQIPTNNMPSPIAISIRSKPSPSGSCQTGMASVPLYQFFRKKPKDIDCASHGKEKTFSKLKKSTNHEEIVPPSPQSSCTSPKSSDDDTTSYSGKISTLKDEDILSGETTIHSCHESLDDSTLLLLLNQVGFLEKKFKTISNMKGEIERKYTQEKSESENPKKDLDKGSKELHVTCHQHSEFSNLELAEATNNFGDALRIGKGEIGTVYKGVLHKTTVSIKKLHPLCMLGHLEFHNEVAILSRFRHANLVTLIGACEDEHALVYEFLPCGSLEDRLACKDDTPPLSWQARVRICAEICSALMFLHSARPQSVVHGDLKPSNILLDANLVSKLDFGLDHLLSHPSTSPPLCCQTYDKGYLDPSITSFEDLTPSSDVYSFGIIILQLLTARPAFHIVEYVQSALNNDSLQEILDTSVRDWPYIQAQQLAFLGLKCCACDRKNRPDLVNEVWRILEAMKKSAIGSLSYSEKVEDCSNIPYYFYCPIFQEIMSNPYIAADGYTYEAEAIRGWLQSGRATSPITNLKLKHENLTPNHALRSAIQERLQGRKHDL